MLLYHSHSTIFSWENNNKITKLNSKKILRMKAKELTFELRLLDFIDFYRNSHQAKIWTMLFYLK